MSAKTTLPSWTRRPKKLPDSSNASQDLGSQSEDSVNWKYLTFDEDVSRLPGGELAGDDMPELSRFQNPLHWSRSRKATLLTISCTATTLTACTAGVYAPGIEQMEEEWNVSRVAANVGITVFTVGFAISPMFLAPLSEINGRRPIFLATGALFFIFSIACAVTQSYTGMIVSRFLVGCASSTFSTMVGGVVSDIYATSERNTPMTFFTTGAMFGTGLGPMVAAFIAQHTTWRWMFYVHSITIFALAIALLLVFKETRGNVILSRKAKALNKWYDALERQRDDESKRDGREKSPPTERVRWKVLADEERASLLHMIRLSLYRPIHMLFTEPVVFSFSLWVSFAWAVLYSMFSIIPYTFRTVYDFDLEEANAVFAAVSVGAIISTIICLYQERVAAHFGRHSATPEGRLYYTCIQSVLLPISLFWFGWSSTPSTPWIVPAMAMGAATMGIFSIYLAVFNYLADVYGPYASSAIAAQSFARNMVGGAFPLFTEQMFETLGIGPAASLMGGIAVLLTLVPWVLVLYGPKIRERSKFASALVAK